MIPAIALKFVAGLLGPNLGKYAALLIYAALIALLIGGLGVAKCSYDRRVIATHDAKQDVATAKADKKADNHAADSRVVDITREQDEKVQTQGAIDNAKRDGTDPRTAYYECVRKQQSARRSGQPSPQC